MKRLIIFLIRMYQNTFSKILGNQCRFIPTCSEYTIEAIKKYGIVKGLALGFKRIMRCNPMAKGGFDLVP